MDAIYTRIQVEPQGGGVNIHAFEIAGRFAGLHAPDTLAQRAESAHAACLLAFARISRFARSSM
jgi:hypothetical protein